MKGKKAYLIAAAGLVLSISACTTYQVDAATYQWTDKQGKINTSQRPPIVALTTSKAPSKSGSKAEKNNTAIQQYNCQEAKELLNSLQQSESSELTSENALLKAKQDLKKFCQAAQS